MCPPQGACVVYSTFRVAHTRAAACVCQQTPPGVTSKRPPDVICTCFCAPRRTRTVAPRPLRTASNNNTRSESVGLCLAPPALPISSTGSCTLDPGVLALQAVAPQSAQQHMTLSMLLLVSSACFSTVLQAGRSRQRPLRPAQRPHGRHGVRSCTARSGRALSQATCQQPTQQTASE